MCNTHILYYVNEYRLLSKDKSSSSNEKGVGYTQTIHCKRLISLVNVNRFFLKER